ncbi:MAG: SAM-dependent chlorinase/fluorinase [Anaerolineae bacterium]|nr:SAM-dependent chlorinase/fluorinase [Anaerolineae bacterium]
MTSFPIIALITDFGIQDHYAAAMKGVILEICRQAQIVDITHAVPPQNIHRAAYILYNAYAYFPEGTIFVAVVDPGVGSSRRAVVVQHQGKMFVVPDNGLLSYVLAGAPGERPDAVELTNTQVQLSRVSSTFHGRDIFAPAAAHLARGVPISEMGGGVDDLVRLRLPECAIAGDTITGNVWDIDTFGNIVTTIGRLRWVEQDKLLLQPAFGVQKDSVTLDAQSLSVEIGDRLIAPLHRTYAAFSVGQAGSLVGSEGFLEIAVREGNAAQYVHAAVGDPVKIQIKAS